MLALYFQVPSTEPPPPHDGRRPRSKAGIAMSARRMTRVLTPFRIFVSSPLPASAAARLAATGARVTTAGGDLGLDDPRFTSAPGAYEALVVFLSHPLDAALIARATSLRLIATVSVGTD